VRAILPVVAGLFAGLVGAWLAGRGSLSGWALLVSGVAGAAAWGWWSVRELRRGEAARRLAEFQARQREEELTWLRRVADALVSGETLDQVLGVVGEAATDLLASESAAIGFVVEEGRFVRIVAGTGPVAIARDRLLPVDNSLLGWVVTHEQPLTSPDMAADARNFPVPDLQLQTIACVPLRASGFVIGVLAVFNRLDGRPFHPLDLRDGVWTAEHLCGADLYRGAFRALGPDRWQAEWEISGPRKDQVLRGLFTRAA